MIINKNIHNYIQLFQSQIECCSSVQSDDRKIVYRQGDKRTWYIRRSGDVTKKGFDILKNPKANQPLLLGENGLIDFSVLIRERPKNTIEIVYYRICFMNLPENNNKINELRYDYSQGQQRGEGWDDELNDNPQHPQAHIHINFCSNNDCRMPTQAVCPILVLRAFDHWYYKYCLR